MGIKSLDLLVSEGAKLLSESDPMDAHRDFNYWTGHVTEWLNQTYPDTGLSAQWMSIGSSFLVTSNGYSNDDSTWTHFKSVVEKRMAWLGLVTMEAAKLRNSIPATIQDQAQIAGRREIKLQLTSRAYVDPARIEGLQQISASFDLSKLIRLCEELNVSFAAECYLSLTMLTRAILDHIPPIFGFTSFKELANNYGGAGKSFKDQMQLLETSSRKIADGYLHTPIRTAETLPTITQVDFSNSLDTLIAEIIRLLKEQRNE